MASQILCLQRLLQNYDVRTEVTIRKLILFVLRHFLFTKPKIFAQKYEKKKSCFTPVLIT